MSRKPKESFVDIVPSPVLPENDVHDFTTAMEGAKKAAKELKIQIEDTFGNTAVSGMSVDMDRFSKKMSDALLVMRFHLGKLRVALTEAAAPIGAVFLPAINQAIALLTDFVRSAGLVLGAVFGTDALADSADNAAEAEKELGKAAVSAGKAARKSLAGFDQINRLEGNTGASGSTGAADKTPKPSQPDTLTPQLQAIADKIMALIAPLQAIDLTALKEALAGLAEAFSQLGTVAGSALEWLWHTILTPFAKWVLEELAPVLTETLSGALELVTAAIEPVTGGFQILWQSLQPIVAFIGESVILALDQWKQAMEALAQVFQEKGPVMESIFRNMGVVITAIWSVVQPILSQMQLQFGITFGQIGKTVASIMGSVIDALAAVTEYLAGIFTGDWERAWGGISGFLVAITNSMVGSLNLILSIATGAINGVIRLVNSLSFTVPDWVPGIGGNRFGFRLNTVNTPRIPYLAQGAVLPANKPFLAMVGDQKHGTNVEAPLATIQEAVALVMGDQMDAMMAGFNATVEVQREILQAVLGIRVGDEVIGRAAARYAGTLARARGNV